MSFITTGFIFYILTPEVYIDICTLCFYVLHSKLLTRRFYKVRKWTFVKYWTILRLFKIIVLLSNGNWNAPAYGGNYLKTKKTNGRFRVKTTEVRRVHVHSSLLVVTSNQNASKKKKNRLNIYPKPVTLYTLSDSWITDILRI